MRRRNKSSESLEGAAHQTAQVVENSQPDTSTGSSDLEAGLANAEAHRADAERRNEGYVASIRELEIRLMNAEARLADAQRMNQKYGDLIVDLEARCPALQDRGR
jgi:hypothetical protein